MTGTIEPLVVKFSDFCKEVYEVDFDKELEFYGTDSSDVEDEELLQALAQHRTHSVDDLRNAIIRAKQDAFEGSYRDEYYDASRKLLRDKVDKDFSNLEDFFEIGGYELEIEGKIPVSVDLDNDTITFPSPDKLLAVIINCINGEGMFNYDSIVEFKEQCGDGLDAIANHIHWLKFLEGIYGTIHSIFKIDVHEELQYKSDGFGDSSYTLEDVRYQLEFN